MSNIQNDLKALINKVIDLKDEHINSMAKTILNQTDFCIKYNVDEAKAQHLAELYIEGNIPQFRNILLFNELLDENDTRYVPLITEDKKYFFKSSLCPEITSIDPVPMELWKY